MWIRERGIWGEYSEKTGARMVELMRLGKGEAESLEKRPGQLFGPEEVWETHSYLVIPCLLYTSRCV